MDHDDIAALVHELTNISISLKELVSRLTDQNTEIKALISLLEQKGLLQPGEFDRLKSPPRTPAHTAPQRCRRAK